MLISNFNTKCCNGINKPQISQKIYNTVRFVGFSAVLDGNCYEIPNLILFYEVAEIQNFLVFSLLKNNKDLHTVHQVSYSQLHIHVVESSINVIVRHLMVFLSSFCNHIFSFLLRPSYGHFKEIGSVCMVVCLNDYATTYWYSSSYCFWYLLVFKSLMFRYYIKIVVIYGCCRNCESIVECSSCLHGK